MYSCVRSVLLLLLLIFFSLLWHISAAGVDKFLVFDVTLKLIYIFIITSFSMYSKCCFDILYAFDFTPIRVFECAITCLLCINLSEKETFILAMCDSDE